MTTTSTFNIQEALANGAYIAGTTGTGKSDLAMQHAEAMMQAGVTVIIFDATQDWIKRSSIPYYITVTPDVPYRFELNQKSLIFDMSLLNPRQQFTVVKNVCQAIWDHQVRNRTHWYYVIFEEGSVYFPQGCLKAKRYQTLVQFATQGRNYDIRFEVITQFSAMIDKDIMKYMKQRYFGNTDEPNDTDYIISFFRRNQQEKIANQLEELQPGQFIYKRGNHVEVIYNKEYQSTTRPEPISEQTTQTQPQQLSNTWQTLAMTLQIGAMLIFIISLILVVSMV